MSFISISIGISCLTYLQSCHPRPDFKSSASQSSAVPLVLDKSRGIQVTSAINRWLRDYQREGVEFFYERYKEGRGGILGDDMGLGVSTQQHHFLHTNADDTQAKLFR